MAEPVNNCFSTELVYEDSNFNEAGVRRFVEEVNLAERYVDYAIVSIIGPQSSGKSTLLNHLFGTNFKVMNAQEGRSQATKGIWLAQSPTLGPRYLAVDVEGTDGRERGNDTAFEKRSALFAFAISDVVILNIWCTNVGLVHGSCQPLLRIVFRVMKKLFAQRKINLIFVLRDKTETPLDKLKVLLEKDIQKIWNDIVDPQDCANSPLDDHFNIKVVGLSHYHDAEAEFKKEVCDLKLLVEDTCTIGGVNPDWTPGSDFVDKAITVWDKIKAFMPAHRPMLEHIRRDSLQSFHKAFENELNNSTDFSDTARKCIHNFLTRLDNQLQDALIQESNWSDATSLREQLLQHVNDHVEDVRWKKVDDLVRQQRIMLTNELEGPIDSYLKAANEITWVEIRRELESKTQSATVQLLNALSTYELDEEMRHNLVQELENNGRNFVRVKASRAADPGFVVILMKKRFIELFSFDSNTTIRVWEENAQVEEAMRTAQSSVIKMLSVLAAVRIVDHNDTIEKTLLYAIRDAHLDTLNSTNWEQVIQEDILLQPSMCKDLWNDFLPKTTPIVNQAFEEARKKKWKKYATICLGSLAIGGGAVAVANYPIIAAGAARAASAARTAFAASDVATARTILSGATTTATAAYFAWKKQREDSRETERPV